MVYERVSGTQLIGMKINLTESILILTIVSAVTSCMFHRDVYSYGAPIQTMNATVNATAVATFCHQTTYHFAVALVTVGHIILAHLFFISVLLVVVNYKRTNVYNKCTG